jgi:putative FmdB family regulatory protein
MPTYEFRCANGHTFDQFHKISDAPSTATCPVCGAVAERAISGGAGLVFKGSGFYLTDYGKNAHRTGGAAPAKAEAGGAEGGGKSGGSGGKDASGGSNASGGSGSGGSSAGSSSGNPSGGNPSGGSSSGGSSSGSSSGGTASGGGSSGSAA